MLAIIDYKAGNLTSVERAVRHLGGDCKITRSLEEIARADRLIFPGVGAAGASMDNLRSMGLDQAIKDAVGQGKPVLGICVGCQIIFEKSEEDLTDCLGLIPGMAKRFPVDHKDQDGNRLKVPHMGWNGIKWLKPHPVFAGLPEEAEFYFVHSYYPQPANAENSLGVTNYGLDFTSAVAKGSLVAVQFHAEKSGRPGLKILENFMAWDGREGSDA